MTLIFFSLLLGLNIYLFVKFSSNKASLYDEEAVYGLEFWHSQEKWEESK